MTMNEKRSIDSFNIRYEIDLIKRDVNISEKMKIGSFQAKYATNGTIDTLRFTFVTQIGRKYIQIDANYRIESGKYMYSIIEFDDYFGYDTLYDEDTFTDFIKLFDYKSFKPKDTSVDYDKYYIQYVSGPNNFSVHFKYDTYLVMPDKCEMLTNKFKRVKGFGLWVFGLKLIDGVEESLSSNLYIFDPEILTQ